MPWHVPTTMNVFLKLVALWATRPTHTNLGEVSPHMHDTLMAQPECKQGFHAVTRKPWEMWERRRVLEDYLLGFVVDYADIDTV